LIYKTDRLIVRPWKLDEVERVYDMYSRWEVVRWVGVSPKAMTSLDEARARIDRWSTLHESTGGRFGLWAVEVQDTGVVAGTVVFKLLPNSDDSPSSDIEVGWHFHPDSWGHGYATEAARGAVDRGFASGIPEIFAVVHRDNAPSQAVCRRLGMTPIGKTDRWYGVEAEAFQLIRPA